MQCWPKTLQIGARRDGSQDFRPEISAIQLHCTVRLTAVIFHHVILITCDLIGYTTSWTFLSCNWGPQLSTYGDTGLCKGTLLGSGYITISVSLCSSLWPGADKRHLQATRRNTQRRGRASGGTFAYPEATPFDWRAQIASSQVASNVFFAAQLLPGQTVADGSSGGEGGSEEGTHTEMDEEPL